MREEKHTEDLSDIMNGFWKLYVKEYRSRDFNSDGFWERVISEFGNMVKRYEKTEYKESAMNISEALIADLEQESRKQ